MVTKGTWLGSGRSLWHYKVSILSHKNTRFLSFLYQKVYRALMSYGVKNLQTSIGDFHVQVRVIKPVLKGNANWEPVSLWTVTVNIIFLGGGAQWNRRNYLRTALSDCRTFCPWCFQQPGMANKKVIWLMAVDCGLQELSKVVPPSMWLFPILPSS